MAVPFVFARPCAATKTESHGQAFPLALGIVSLRKEYSRMAAEDTKLLMEVLAATGEVNGMLTPRKVEVVSCC